MASSKKTSEQATPVLPRRGRKSVNGDSMTERRQGMLEIAAELFAEQGFRSTTVRQIGDAAGVLSGSLYHHFDSKEAIVDVILSEYFTSLLAAYRKIIADGASPRETLRELVRAAFHSLGDHRAAITVVQNERNYLTQFPRFSYVADAEAEVREMWTTVIEDGKRSGAFRQEVDTPIAYRFIRDSLWVAVRWFTPNGRLSADELADQYLELMMRGLEDPSADLNPHRPLFSG